MFVDLMCFFVRHWSLISIANAGLIVLFAVIIVACIPSAPQVSGDSCTVVPGCGESPSDTVCTLTSVIDETVLEECKVRPGNDCEETTAATTCTLTPQQLNADGDVVDGTGTCAVATGSGRCNYIAPVVEVEGSCAVATDEDGAASGTGSCEYVAPVSGDFLDQTWALILQVVATASICLATKLEGANSEAAIAVRLLCIVLSFAAVRLIINGLAGLAVGASEAENNEEDSSLGVAVKCSCASDS